MINYFYNNLPIINFFIIKHQKLIHFLFHLIKNSLIYLILDNISIINHSILTYL